MSVSDQNLKAANEANQIFDKMRKLTEEHIAKGENVVDVLKIVNEAGLKVDGHVLDQLDIPSEFILHPFLPWSEYFPWQPLWSYYWGIKFPGSFAARAFLPPTGKSAAQVASISSRVAVAFSGNGRLSTMPSPPMP